MSKPVQRCERMPGAGKMVQPPYDKANCWRWAYWWPWDRKQAPSTAQVWGGLIQHWCQPK